MPNARKCNECGQTHVAGANGAVYCGGPLLRAVQMSNLYRDSKYFVDMTCRYSPERILADYQLFSSCKKNESSVKHLTNFVDNHFDQPGTELEYWCPPDYRCEPKFVEKINDPALKKFAMDLNRIWKQLGRTMKDCVRTSPGMYSLIYVPNPFIVPSGRFIEFYYWDTYWIVRGLLYSGMFQTARGMIDNLLYLVKQFQMVPGSNRVYYWGRSQPPLLVPMVKSYVEFTKDEQYAIQNLPALELEMETFLQEHSVQVEGRTMYQYRDKSSGPRPEAYREDEAVAASFNSAEEKEDAYSHIKAACESGQAFSSRWFISSSGNNVGTMANIKTNWIVPVELNCILFRNCKTLGEFFTLAGCADKAKQYRTTACGLIKAITAVLWNEERGVWLDYDIKNRKQRDYFAVTNLSPLWLHAYPIADTEKISKSVMCYIEENKLDCYPGGVPHTLCNTGQLWDYPNVYPPMMLMLIDGLNNLGTPEATDMACRWTQRWVLSNYEAYTKTNFMFEKYNCEESGLGVGSPDGQNHTGYGWTNGVLIELLVRYGCQLTSNSGNGDADADCNGGSDNMASALQDCPITSDAYLEKKAAADADEYAKMCGEQNMQYDECQMCCGAAMMVQDIASFATSETGQVPPSQQNPYDQRSGQQQPRPFADDVHCPCGPDDSPNVANYNQSGNCGMCGSDDGDLKPGNRRYSADPQCTSCYQDAQPPAAQSPPCSAPPAQQYASDQLCTECGQAARSGQGAQGGPCGQGGQGGAQGGQPPQTARSMRTAQGGLGGPSACSTAQPQQGQKPQQYQQPQQQQQQYQQGQQRQIAQSQGQLTDICSYCEACRARALEEQACANEPQPIRIEMNDDNCKLELSPSEQEEIKGMCPCASKDLNAKEGEDGNSDCGDEDDCMCGASQPNPVSVNKIFPLADEIGCPQPSEQPVPEQDSGCECDKAAREKREREAQE
ncbi:trehalase [Drosophila mojavensis]|uniref:trehalase n=1 Tax=Drosophila mojavensis TaxID=7230 RepID=UPI001CD0521A|nr:trehalase [Drosophila mojavensis]